MADGIKDIIFNKITDEILDIVVGLSKEELNNLINQNKRQRILIHCIEKFADSDFFKTEFRNFIFCENKNLILSIEDDKIDLTLGKERIAENLYDKMKLCFVSDDNNSYKRLLEIIVGQYIQQAETTVKLYDILRIQQENFYSIDNDLKEVKNILIENKNKEYELNIKKSKLLRNELNNEMSIIISDIMNRYLYFVCKESPILQNKSQDKSDFNLIDSMSDKICDIVENISGYIKEDFCIKPVKVIRANGFEQTIEEIEYFKFMEFEFKDKILKGTDTILKYKDLITDEIYVLVLELRNSLNGNLFPSLYMMGQTNIIQNPNIKINVESFRKELVKIGNNIIEIKKKLL